MTNDNATARNQALEVFSSRECIPTGLVKYQSAGRVLLLGDDASISQWRDLPAPLRLTRLFIGTGRPRDVELFAERRDQLALDGRLGAFRLQLRIGDTAMPAIEADIVVDTCKQPLLSTQLPPAGYLALPLNAQSSSQVQQQLMEMVGEFEKPRYFQHDVSICAHSVNGREVCRQCIDACPAEAISSRDGRIEVNPHLCQGGGTCATVCPSGAMQYVFPRLRDQGERIRAMLQTYREQGGLDPVVLFHSGDADPEPLLQQHANLLPVRLEELASAGADLWLTTLAYGARQILLLKDTEIPPLSLGNIAQQLLWCREAIIALGLPADSIRLIDVDEIPGSLVRPALAPPAQFVMPENKRDAMFSAIDYLQQQADNPQAVVELPTGAPFGQIQVDAASCTLCMACVSACPGNALQDGSNRELPELSFIEAKCLQCDACSLTCPEDAISISPRLLLDRDQRNRPQQLNRDAPFACISCGKEFAAASVIAKITNSLQGHHMFQSERALQRLSMCEDCRVADIIQDPDAMNGQNDPMVPRH